MSDNPFRDSGTNNPFADDNNPYSPTAIPGQGYVASPQARLLPPAIILMILATMTVAVSLLQIPRVMAQAGDRGFPYVAGSFTPALMNLAIVCGAVQMARLRSYSSAMTAAILAVIPACSPCVVVGIPFGIWAIIVLRDPSVKAAFR